MFKISFVSVLVSCLVVVGGGWVVYSQTSPQQASWETSAHNNVNTTLSVSTVEVRQATAAHCARCHSDQGFKAWLPQLLRGDSGLIKGPDGKDATVAHLTSLGLTKADAKPIGCTTCHTDNGGLRVQNSTPMLPAGFSVQAVGEGAMCMTCHNTRNGRKKWDTEDPGGYGGPHHSAQADMIAAKNFYFINDTGDRISPHAKFTGGSCTTCHMTLHEDDKSHSFTPVEASCTSCHGKDMNLGFVERPTKFLLSQIRNAMSARVQAVGSRIAYIRAYNAEKETYTDNVQIDGKNIRSVTDVVTTGGQLAFKIRMADGSEWISPVAEFREAPAPNGTRVFAQTNVLVRAAWNYAMVSFDGSWGVHNPTFSREVLLATLQALR